MKKLTILLLLTSTLAYGQMTVVVDKFSIYPAATFLPKAYDAAKTYDLILSLHGLGEAGGGTSNLSRIYNNGLPNILKNGFIPPVDVIVCAPQDNWGGIDAKNVPAIIADIKAKYKVGNIHLTGLSAGGQGAGSALFGISEAFLKTITSAVIISPGYIPTGNVGWIKNASTRVWLQAGTQSADVNPGYTANATNLHNAINAVAPGKSKLTVKAGIGHGGSFTTPYRDTAFWSFLQASPVVITPPVVRVDSVSRAYHDSVVADLTAKMYKAIADAAVERTRIEAIKQELIILTQKL